MIIALYWLNLQITNFCFDIFYAQCSGMIKLYIIGCDIRAKNVCIFFDVFVKILLLGSGWISNSTDPDLLETL